MQDLVRSYNMSVCSGWSTLAVRLMVTSGLV